MEEFLSYNLIPSWLVTLNLLLAGIMLRVSFKKKLRVGNALFISGSTLILDAIVYWITFGFLDGQMRGLVGRLVIITLCMSLYLPLGVSYLRSRNRDK